MVRYFINYFVKYSLRISKLISEETDPTEESKVYCVANFCTVSYILRISIQFDLALKGMVILD
jgi:hypothetical protein